MGQRIDLQKILVNLLGSRNVYYQPPNTVKMKYPAIVYSRDTINVRHANNHKYLGRVAYLVTLIDSSPQSEFLEKIEALPLCSHTRHYTAEGLNHDVFRLYY